MPTANTGTQKEKQQYAQDRLARIADLILNHENTLTEKLAVIVPEHAKELEDLASDMDRLVGRIYSTIESWRENG
jgi:hypothetical protein